MEPTKPSAALFDVFLRLRPTHVNAAQRFLDVEHSDNDNPFPTHITVQPPSDNRKRAVEKFAFTRVFEEDAPQLEVLEGSGAVQLIEGVLGSKGKDGKDGLLATLGVTGSGKSHTILGSKTQRGITQMTLDVLYANIGQSMVHPTAVASVFTSIAAADVSEAHLVPASTLLDATYGEIQSNRGSCSRAQTPMPVESPVPIPLIPGVQKPADKLHMNLRSIGTSHIARAVLSPAPELPGSFPISREGTPDLSALLHVQSTSRTETSHVPSMGAKSALPLPGHFARLTRSKAAKQNSLSQDTSCLSIATHATAAKSHRLPRPSAMPTTPSVEHIQIACDSTSEYAIILSMYEVYNDRIYDLLTGAATRAGAGKATNQKLIRRPLLFKSTEMSPDRKVVAGLRKVVCATLEEALSVLEMGLTERKVAGTGSNAVSSRSHGFFSIEVKKRPRVSGATSQDGAWSSAALTIVDLAGSERARQAKTQGQTLAEAGKINESLMYLGQCMQMQSDQQDGKPSIVPFRQCKLTELLFSNSFPSAPSAAATTHHPHAHSHRNPQKGIMIVTADPVGDFNATSQILRYSALAREVTVPRIPSVTSTILAPQVAGNAVPQTPNTSRPGTSLATHNDAPPSTTEHDLAAALSEITSLRTNLEILHLRLTEEQAHTSSLETFIQTSDLRWADREAEIREECFEEMERVLAVERERWKEAWEVEGGRVEEVVDRKIEIVTRGDALRMDVWEDAGRGVLAEREERIEDLEGEVENLRRRVRELEGGAHQSPTKRPRGVSDERVFRELQDENRDLRSELAEAKRRPVGAVGGSPMKKLKPLKARKWDLEVGGEDA